MIQMNLVLKLGGKDQDIEADEMSFHNSIKDSKDKIEKIQWIREKKILDLCFRKRFGNLWLYSSRPE